MSIPKTKDLYVCYCDNCGFSASLTRDEYLGLETDYMSTEKVCPVCSNVLEVKIK